MKKNLWLILAVLSLLGMIIMPSMAHSAVIEIPNARPASDVFRVTLPINPVPRVSLQALQIQPGAMRLQASLVPTVVPTVMPVSPVVLAPAAAVQAPVTRAPRYAVLAPAQSAIPSARIEGISAVRKDRKGVGAIISRLSQDNKGNKVPSAAKLAALFDGAAKPAPAAVPVGAAQTSPVEATEDTSLTLPESDLADEIGLSY
jgi:hypothetical protein